MATKLTADEKSILAQMHEGWKPFPFQCGGTEKSLIRKGLVRLDSDERGRQILVLVHS